MVEGHCAEHFAADNTFKFVKNTLTKRSFKDMNVNEIYEALQTESNAAYDPIIDDHSIWDITVENAYAARINFAFKYWLSSNQKFKDVKFVKYIKNNLPDSTEDEINSIKTLQLLVGIKYVDSHYNLSGDEAISIFNQLLSSTPEDFAAISMNVLLNNKLRDLVFHNDIWLKVSQAHRMYIM